ncbi:MAG: 30S ribosomal protein S8 [Planctomycetes bacterium]|nr:30S ribosomal protein S8 [Planctomycetota bacterium]
MSMTDPIGDLLTAIRNANEIGKKSLVLPASVLKVHVVQVLKEEGYLANFSVETAVPQSKLKVDLKYGPDGERVIRTIERVSTPGRRVYSSPKELVPVLKGLGIYVLSTSKGVMSDRTARAQNIGGEVLAKIY